MARRIRRTDPFFMVIDPDTHSGAGFKGIDHADAARRAMKHSMMKGRGITTLSVRLFAGHVNGSRDTTAILFDVASL